MFWPKHLFWLTTISAKTSLPKEYILAKKGCFGRIKAISARMSHFGQTTENNFYRIKCFCWIIGRIIDRLFGRYDIRLPTIMNHYELNEVHLKRNFYNPANHFPDEELDVVDVSGVEDRIGARVVASPSGVVGWAAIGAAGRIVAANEFTMYSTP